MDLSEIAKRKKESRKKTPIKSHKTESPKAKAKEASQKFRKKNDVLSISFPKNFSDFLDYIANKGLRKQKKNEIILDYLSETSILQDFENWKKEEGLNNE